MVYYSSVPPLGFLIIKIPLYFYKYLGCCGHVSVDVCLCIFNSTVKSIHILDRTKSFQKPMFMLSVNNLKSKWPFWNPGLFLLPDVGSIFAKGSDLYVGFLLLFPMSLCFSLVFSTSFEKRDWFLHRNFSERR